MWRQCKRGLCTLLGSGESPDDTRRHRFAPGSVRLASRRGAQLVRLCRANARRRRAAILDLPEIERRFCLVGRPLSVANLGRGEQRPGRPRGSRLEAWCLYSSRTPFQTLTDFAAGHGIRFCDPSPAFGRAASQGAVVEECPSLFSHRTRTVCSHAGRVCRAKRTAVPGPRPGLQSMIRGGIFRRTAAIVVCKER